MTDTKFTVMIQSVFELATGGVRLVFADVEEL